MLESYNDMKGLKAALRKGSVRKPKAKNKKAPIQTTFAFEPGTDDWNPYGCRFCDRACTGLFCNEDHALRYLSLTNPRRHREIMYERIREDRLKNEHQKQNG